MGAVEDVRKALQDVVAPDLKALQVEVKEGFASVEKQFVAIERVTAIRHELLLAELRTAQVIAESRHEAILKALDIDKRLERVEARQASQQATA
jgi:hypothetical protein